ncbi:Rv1678 family membrane protein [Nocardioides donggukensis]|uniref:DoxX family membrane protein n=1 Tax=Nocardioides donggukensis TaxID=2774019 RepID=A0A927K5T5_9ACTN|nr:hypothetical protein [Nocardioides donggukensis]MBD8871059.1 hypothetical protein [Nocardioides donggukensis]
MTDRLTWVLAPAVEDGPRSHAIAAAGLRILVGVMWLYNVSWKRAPDFGQEAENGLYKFTSFAVSDPVFPPFSWVVEKLVLPNFEIFGWGVLASETALAVLLLSGAFVRVAALLGVAQSVAIALSVTVAPHEWPWSYYLMIGAHLLILFSAAGRYAAVDAVRAGRGGVRLGTVWGGLAVVAGLIAAAVSLGDPFAAAGTNLGTSDFSVGIGRYNLLGGVLLVAVGVLLLLAARGGRAALAWAAAGLGALGALSLYAQLGFTDPILGGSPTTAAVYLACAAVAAGLALADRGARPGARPAVDSEHSDRAAP